MTDKSDLVRVAVVGGGPVGLMTAFALASSQNKYAISVIDKFDERATYPKAGAFWLPFASGGGDLIERKYAEPTYGFLHELEQQQRDFGLVRRNLISYRCKRNQNEYYSHDKMKWLADTESCNYAKKKYYWKKLDAFVQDADGLELENASISKSWSCDTFAIDPVVFVDGLRSMLAEECGVSFIEQNVQRDSGLSARFDAVVCCTGIRGFLSGSECAVRFGGDLKPKKGILARIETDHDLDTIHLISDQPFDALPVYVVPLKNAVVIGGTVESTDAENLNSYSVSDVEKTLLRNRLKKTKLPGKLGEFLTRPNVKWTAGVRPKMQSGPIVQLESEMSPFFSGLPVVMNIGHGGSGFTFGIGCGEKAEEELARTFFLSGTDDLPPSVDQLDGVS